MLKKHNQNVGIFVEMLQNDTELLDSLSGMAFFEARESDIEMLLESPTFYVAIASLLNAKGYRISESFLELFDASQADLPKFNLQQASAFLNGFFGNEAEWLKPLEPKKEHYFEMAKRMGLVVNKKVVLNESLKIRRMIAGSVGKLDAIVEIVRLEHGQLKERLRMVILTDHIKMTDTACQSMGVVPIWRKLKGAVEKDIAIGVLCGSLILLPEHIIGKLYKALADNNIPNDSFKISRFENDTGYIRIIPKMGIRNHIVGMITEMFCAGDLQILVGTQALLGEGWDAPAINSLILSSTVSSYMLSNQMRGRAIRIDKDHPDKVSNIWHLASIDFPEKEDTSLLGTFSDNDMENICLYTYDLIQLSARFQGFEAPGYYGKHEITSGIERILEAPSANPMIETPLKNKVKSLEDLTKKLAPNREQTRQWWKDALYLGYGRTRQRSLSTGVQTPKMTTRFLMYKGYKFIVSSFLATVLVTYLILLRAFPPLHLSVLAAAVVGIFFGVVGMKYLKTGTVEGVLKQVAITVLETLSSQGLIKTSIKNVGLHVTEADGALFVCCSNLPAQENNLFIQSLQEFLDPVDNPRYLLVKRDKIFGKIRQTDYFSVPAILTAKKSGVETFRQLWENHIGECEIVYTRNLEGRKLLLKARKEASSAISRRKSKRLSKWQ